MAKERLTSKGAETVTEDPVFLVMVSTGEYSDRTETPVAIYRNEDAAKDAVKRLEALIAGIPTDKFGPEIGGDKWKRYTAAREAQNDKFYVEFPWMHSGEKYDNPDLDDDSRAWLVPMRLYP